MPDSGKTSSGTTNGTGGAEASVIGVLEKPPVVDTSASGLIPAWQAVRLRAIPYSFEGKKLLVAMLDPSDLSAADEVSVSTGRSVKRVGLAKDAFAEMLRLVHGVTAAEMAAQLDGGDRGENSQSDLVANLEAIEADDLHRMAEQPSLINLVNLLILEAIRARASDVHVEPFERALIVKYRVDGVLVEQPAPPKRLQPAITSRIKIMAGMNIAERYAPQDGHITLRFEGRKIDIRVSTVPTLYGESVVMRILDKENIQLDLQALGMNSEQRGLMQKLIDLPHGMVLVTGPTGSGKTTTLYAALTKLYDPTLKIITIEDPVEYELNGVNQIPVNPKRGLTFADGLRSILRQDPDVIMVGEIRDYETAEIAVRAALTGHLLFSTLHTNNAVSAVGRLLDMGIEPFLLSSVLEGVLAQRLGRRTCQLCLRETVIPDALMHRLSESERQRFVGGRCRMGAGCDECNNTGMRGRLGFYEVVVTTGPLREAIAKRASSQEMMRLAGSSFITMRKDGIQKAAEGQTTIEEVLRATQDADEAQMSAATVASVSAGGRV